ncbi:MAG: FecR domain-containing protein [Chitinophagaceae bacterium]|nr:FecR domain-containing protein [Chitinophagaceae bacterium]
MQAGNSRLEELYTKWFNKTATPQEKEELMNLLASGAAREDLGPSMDKIWDQLGEDEGYSLKAKEQLADTILRHWPSEPMIGARPKIRWFRWAAAASVLLLAGVLIWKLSFSPQPKQQSETAIVIPEVINPGSNGAILTLADGRQIMLDSTAHGVFANQGSTEISLQHNQLIYQAAEDSGSTEVSWNTMSTPRGRQFQLLLPDGSRVWLNAASSIRYPVAFRGPDRKVIVSGEAYFEVAPDQEKPFYVQTKNQLVQALGTSFNVNAYGNENTEQTTLIAGSIKVNMSSGKPLYAVLEPGQQAQLDNQKQSLSIAEKQSEAAIAWKNGYFNLEDLPFDKVMKKLERWYDIEVVYQNGVPDLHFYGGISRNLTLDALIRALKVSEVRFKIGAGRRLVVYK